MEPARARRARRIGNRIASAGRAAVGAALIGCLLALAASPVRAASPLVVVLPTTGVVDGAMASYVTGGITQAATDGAAAVVIELNTPGGSLESMQDIVAGLLEAPIPTIVWVSPAGGRAASAGTFITLAANLAYMAPGTEIGAASPVGPNGEDIPGTEGQKVRNDAIAKIRSIAETRHRNVDWAVSTVDQAVSSPASQAVQLGAVDAIAGSLDAVLAAAEGKTVTVHGGTQVTLHLAGATTQERGMGPVMEAFHLLSDPNIAFLLFAVGAYSLVFELIHPTVLTGVGGAIAIILAFVGFGSLPLNVAGLLFIGLGVILLVLEASIPSHGLLTLGGVASFALGAAIIYGPPPPGEPAVSVAWPLVAVLLVGAAAFALIVIRAAVRSRRFAAVPLGVAGTPGSYSITPGLQGEVRRELAPVGSVHVAGEEWSARTKDGSPLGSGEKVRVVARDGLTLIVEPLR